MKLGGHASKEEVLGFARRSGLRSGGLPISDGYELALAGGFISDVTIVRISRLGEEALSRCLDEEPNTKVLRLFASVLILRNPPAWVAYWQGDPESLEIVLPDPIRDILRDADLVRPASVDDLEAWAWWDALHEVPPLEEAAKNRKAIGDAAEELSLEFEKARLHREGFGYLAPRVRWVAKESPAYGFDILSFSGTMHGLASPEDAIAIEVKGMAVAARGRFEFYLTQHEWRTASALSGRYLFHFWDGVRLGDKVSAGRREPITIQPTALVLHLPSEPICGSRCAWNSATVLLPLDS
jgi:hypothetical protein